MLQVIGNQCQVGKRFLDFHDLLAQGDVDAMLVVNPDAYHAQVVLEAIAAGKHVLIEKPLCLTLREADAICETEAIDEASKDLNGAYGQLLGLCSHDLSAMRKLLGTPKGVLYAAQRQGGLNVSAAFDYGSYVCWYECGIDNIPRFDAHLEVYGYERILHVHYDTPYVRNLPIRRHITETNGQGGMVAGRASGMGRCIHS